MSKPLLSVVASVAAHAALIVGSSRGPAVSRGGLPALAVTAARAPAVAVDVVRPVRIAASRFQLVERARRDREAGRLELGAFLIDAAAIDADERGTELSVERARSLYAERLSALRAALDADAAAQAVPRVFGDLHYTGTPGGNLAEALLHGEGSCEPLSHLVAAALHDVGLGDRARLRFYGGAIAGITHLAPVVLEGEVERDLMSGRPARPGGVVFPASDLVEAYARAHGLGPSPAVASVGAAASDARFSPSSALAKKSSLDAGYPPNGDRFEGSVPLFAESAVSPPIEEGGEPIGHALGSDGGCPMVPMALLDPPSVWVTTAAGPTAVELLPIPSKTALGAQSSVIAALETRREAKGAGLSVRVSTNACLAGLYDLVGTGFALTSEPDLASRAADGARRAREKGGAALAEVQRLPEAARHAALLDLVVELDGRAHTILFLPGSDPLSFELAELGKDRYWQVALLAGMLVSPRTRARAMALANTLPAARQVEVMHEVFHAHDHARPWAASFPLECPADGTPEMCGSTFVRGYRVQKALGWSLWEAARPPAEVIESLARAVKEERLPDDLTRAFVDYYARNFTWLHAQRPHGKEKIRELLRALADSGLPAADGRADYGLTPSELEAAGRASGR